VVDLVRGLLGRTWQAPDDPDAPRPLGAGDLLVVSPYNAQVNLLRRWLDATGMPDVAVGTVDKFQGQEAPVVILSMAASAHADVSRGMRFLLDRNRLTVAVSRGQWCAYIVRSDVLTDFAPRSPDELIALGSFIGLCSES
jgi:superfamily I DNA and/or RNA helicase